MFSRKRHTALFGLTALGAIAITGCGHHRWNHEKRVEWITEHIADDLDLNEVQRAKLEAVKTEMQAVHKELRTDHDARMDDVLAQITAPELDKAKLQSMFDRHKTIMEQAAPKVLDKLAEFHKSLDDKQKAELADHIKRFRKHWKE